MNAVQLLSGEQQKAVVVEQMREGLAHPIASPYFLIGVAGCALWSVAYVLLIRQGIREKIYTLPVLAICLNFTWELMAVAALPHPNLVWQILEWSWLLLDLFLLGLLFRYGPAVQRPGLQAHFRWVLIALLALCFCGQLSFVVTFSDPLGFVVAFVINLVMSALFVCLYFEREASLKGLNYPAAWLKMIGTGCTSFQCAQLLPLLRPDIESWSFLHFLYISIFFIDAWYVALLHRRRGALRNAVPS